MLEGRRPRILMMLLLAVSIVLVSRHPEILQPTRKLLVEGEVDLPQAKVRDVPPEDAVLARRRQGLRALLRDVQTGHLVPPGTTATALVDQDLVRRLLAPHFPRTYVIEDAYRVTITGAQVSFEDGIALVRLDGRASLLADDRVFADVSLFGDLEVLREQPDAAVLRTQINLLALEARKVAVVVDADAAEDLVERVGQTRVAAFAEVASGLEIPVRHQHEIDLPAVEEGPVRLRASSLPVQLTVLDVKALGGKLWISMAGAFNEAAAIPRFPLRSLPVPETLAGEPSDARTQALRSEVERLRAQLDALAAGDARIAEAKAVQADLALTVGPELFEAGVQRLAERYFDRVEIALEDLKVHKTGERTRKILFKDVVAGQWTLDVLFTSIRGVIGSGRPEVKLAGGSTVELRFPVHIEQGRGRATIRFAWDSRPLIGLFCKDFAMTDVVTGSVEKRAYPVTATFAVTAGEDRLVATPRFSNAFRIHPVPDPSAWRKLAAALEEQNRFGRCDIGIHPDVETASLRALIARGFVVRLPRKLFRPVTLPTRLTSTVDVQGRRVQIGLRQSDLGLDAHGVHYAVHLTAERAP